MRKTILALATVAALAGTALPALAWDRDDDNGYYRHRYYSSDDVYGRPYYPRDYYYHRRYDHDDYYERSAYRRWWCKHHYCGYGFDRPYYRRYGY